MVDRGRASLGKDLFVCQMLEKKTSKNDFFLWALDNQQGMSSQAIEETRTSFPPPMGGGGRVGGYYSSNRLMRSAAE